jgi:hypothetical protein
MRWAVALFVVLAGFRTCQAQTAEDWKELAQAVNGVKSAVERMEKQSFLEKVAGPLVGGLLAIVGGFLSIIAKDWLEKLKRPCLVAAFEPDAGCRRVRDDRQDTKVWIRLKVKNEARRGKTRLAHLLHSFFREKPPANKCRAVLTRVTKSNINTGGYDDLNYHDTIEFVWAYGRMQGQKKPVIEKDIVSGVDYYVDLCCGVNPKPVSQSGQQAGVQPPHLDLTLLHGTKRYKDIINDEGVYRLHILLSAVATPSVAVVVEVNWPKNCHNLGASLISQEVVS